MNITVTIVQNDLKGASSKLRSQISGVLQSTGTAMLADMQQRTPVLTGELRDSERMSVSGSTLRLDALADHAVYVHQGTSRMGARPFMVDAVNAGVPDLTTKIAEAIAGS
jgi:hypothetical protein